MARCLPAKDAGKAPLYARRQTKECQRLAGPYVTVLFGLDVGPLALVSEHIESVSRSGQVSSAVRWLPGLVIRILRKPGRRLPASVRPGSERTVIRGRE